MLHAVLEGYENWDDVPTAHNYAHDFASEGHVSFAFMNLSKISNETGKTATQWKVLHSFVDRSIREIRREIELLDPELIITANLTLHNILDDVKLVQSEEDNVLDVYTSKLNDRIIPIFNTYHWSAPRMIAVRFTSASETPGGDAEKSPTENLLAFPEPSATISGENVVRRTSNVFFM